MSPHGFFQVWGYLYIFPIFFTYNKFHTIECCLLYITECIMYKNSYNCSCHIIINNCIHLFCCCLVTKLCPTLCDPMDWNVQSMSFTISWNLPKLMPIELVMLSNHLIFCHPHLLLPSIFPSIKVFSNESAPHIRWPKYWRFSFGIRGRLVFD